jgi:hypothetical protein
MMEILVELGIVRMSDHRHRRSRRIRVKYLPIQRFLQFVEWDSFFHEERMEVFVFQNGIHRDLSHNRLPQIRLLEDSTVSKAKPSVDVDSLLSSIFIGSTAVQGPRQKAKRRWPHRQPTVPLRRSPRLARLASNHLSDPQDSPPTRRPSPRLSDPEDSSTDLQDSPPTRRRSPRLAAANKSEMPSTSKAKRHSRQPTVPLRRSLRLAAMAFSQ